MRREKAWRGKDDIHTPSFKSLRLVVFANRLDDACNSISDRSKVSVLEFERRSGDAEINCLTNISRKPSRADESLRRNATGVEAVTAKSFFLNEGDPRAKLRRAAGNHQSGRATSNNDQVITAHEGLPN